LTKAESYLIVIPNYCSKTNQMNMPAMLHKTKQEEVAPSLVVNLSSPLATRRISSSFCSEEEDHGATTTTPPKLGAFPAKSSAFQSYVTRG
jgi:hypothetical protein